MGTTSNGVTASHFRTRTASVSLKIDIHPPYGININHVEGESTHSVIMTQGKEILSFIVFTELRKAELEIPKSSVIFKNLVCTSQGFLLLRWEKLCKSICDFAIEQSDHTPLSIYLNKKCQCPRRKKPDGCHGFLCLVLSHVSKYESFAVKIAQLLYHTAMACRWSLVSHSNVELLDKILADSLEALDVVCAAHDELCLGGWECVLASTPLPQVKSGGYQAIILGATAGLALAFLFYKYKVS